MSKEIVRNVIISFLIVIFGSVLILGAINAISKDVKNHIKQSKFIYKEQFFNRLQEIYPNGTVYFTPDVSYIAIVVCQDSVVAVRNQGYSLEIVKLVKNK